MGDATGTVAAKGEARDSDLDDYRALALIWVVVLHALYWLGLVGARWDVWKSLLLFEMPVLLFVAGASNAFGRPKSVRAFYASRLTRILIPFWVYAALCVAYEAWKVPNPARVLDYRWLIPTEPPKSAVAPIAWHIWFVPVYLTVMALFPYFRSAFDRLSGWRRAIPLAVLAAGVLAFDDFGIRWRFGRYVVFYSFWAYLGLYYTTWKARPWPRGVVALVSGSAYFVLWRLLTHGTYQPDFQWNKFPTNFAFFLLSVGHFGTLALVSPWIRVAARTTALRALTAPYRAYGYTVYLFHTLAYVLVFQAFETWPTLAKSAHDAPAVALALLIPFLTLAVPALAWPFSVVERFRWTPKHSIRPELTRRLDAPHLADAVPAHARVRGTVQGVVEGRTEGLG